MEMGENTTFPLSSPGGGADTPLLRVALSGAAGNMGKASVQAIADAPDALLVAAIGHTKGIGEDSGLWAGSEPNGVPIEPGWSPERSPADVLIDFSLPEALLARLSECTAARTAMVICMTGLGDGHFAAMREAAGAVPLVYAENVSKGANLLCHLLGHVGRYLRGAEDIDAIEVDIAEEHARHKKDRPSGTALRMGGIIAEALYDRRVAQRDLAPEPGPRQPRTLGFAASRRRAVNCQHRVAFAWGDEEFALWHAAPNRRVFADGALAAARWLRNRPVGQYDMQQVLGFAATAAEDARAATA